jgi:hypothetical protein
MTEARALGLRLQVTFEDSRDARGFVQDDDGSARQRLRLVVRRELVRPVHSRPARAHAVVVVRKTDGATYQWPWSFNVQLVQPDPALELDEIQGNILAIGPRSSVMLATTNRVSGQVA